jgi:hypothetical protein
MIGKNGACKEGINQIGEFRWLFGEVQMRGILDDGELQAGDAAMYFFQMRGAALVITATNQQDRHN